MNTSTDYYCYVYKREDGTPYYVGKGSKFRFLNKGKNEIKPPKDKSRIFFACEGVSETEAFEMEVALISLLGRKDLGTGILRNRTDGGEGGSGCFPSEESKKRMSDVKKGKTFSEEHKRKISEAKKGKTPSEETRRKISESLKGKVHSEEHRRRVSEGCKGKGPKLKLSDVQQLEIFQRVESGEKVKNLSIEFKVSLDTIYRTCKKLKNTQQCKTIENP